MKKLTDADIAYIGAEPGINKIYFSVKKPHIVEALINNEIFKRVMQGTSKDEKTCRLSIEYDRIEGVLSIKRNYSTRVHPVTRELDKIGGDKRINQNLFTSLAYFMIEQSSTAFENAYESLLGKVEEWEEPIKDKVFYKPVLADGNEAYKLLDADPIASYEAVIQDFNEQLASWYKINGSYEGFEDWYYSDRESTVYTSSNESDDEQTYFGYGH